MSDNHLPEVMTYEEYPGFRSALFLNLTDYYNNTTPQKDYKEDTQSCRLSIESFTPGSTPKGTDKKKNDDLSFKFCLSKDLMKRLEESSPFNVYSEKKMVNDICLSNAEDFIEEDEQENVLQEYTGKFLFGNEDFSTPSTNEQTMFHPTRTSEMRENCEVKKKLNFFNSDQKENKENEGPKQCLNNSSLSNYSNLINNLGVFSSFGKNCGNVYSFSHPYFINSVNGNSNTNGNGFNKFSNSASSGFSDGKITPKSLINVLNGVNSINQNQQISGQGVKGNINMYGKSGWICLFCKNFNYEVRVKCNRCTKSKVETFSTSGVSKSPAVPVNHNVLSKESPTNSISSTSTSSTKECVPITSSSKKKKPFVERAGDWNCYKCKNLNFSFRVTCNRCQLTKKESEKLSDQFFKSNLASVSLRESSSSDNES